MAVSTNGFLCNVKATFLHISRMACLKMAFLYPLEFLEALILQHSHCRMLLLLRLSIISGKLTFTMFSCLLSVEIALKILGFLLNLFSPALRIFVEISF